MLSIHHEFFFHIKANTFSQVQTSFPLIYWIQETNVAKLQFLVASCILRVPSPSPTTPDKTPFASHPISASLPRDCSRVVESRPVLTRQQSFGMSELLGLNRSSRAETLETKYPSSALDRPLQMKDFKQSTISAGSFLTQSLVCDERFQSHIHKGRKRG